MTRILIAGSKGQLGSELVAAAWPSATEVVALDLPDLDLTDGAAVGSAVRDIAPALVVNAAAYTDVDGAEGEPDAAFAVNHLGCMHLAQACGPRSVPLVHVSTDYVFGGWQSFPLREGDDARPRCVYGASKLAGELAIREALSRHVILRTSWLFGVAGKSFVKTMLRLAAERDELRVVDDQVGCPTPAHELAAAIVEIAARVSRDGAVPWGLYHYAGRGETSWFGFATEIFARAQELGLPSPRLVPITTAEYPTAASRPAYSVLDCTRIDQVMGIGTADWRPGLARVLRALIHEDHT